MITGVFRYLIYEALIITESKWLWIKMIYETPVSIDKDLLARLSDFNSYTDWLELNAE